MRAAFLNSPAFDHSIDHLTAGELPADYFSRTVGVFGYGTQYFMTRGLAHANAAQAMSMSYLGLVWGEAAGILLFHEYPNLISLCGTLLIVLATLWFGLKSLGKLPPWLLLGYAPPAAKEPVP